MKGHYELILFIYNYLIFIIYLLSYGIKQKKLYNILLGLKDVSIVVSQLRDMNCIFGNFINKSVLIGYSPGPVT